MLYAYFIRAAYHCCVTILFAVFNSRTLIPSIEVGIAEEGRVDLGLIPNRAFNDFASAKRYLNPLADLRIFSDRILLEQQNQNITLYDYKCLMPLYFHSNLFDLEMNASNNTIR